MTYVLHTVCGADFDSTWMVDVRRLGRVIKVRCTSDTVARYILARKHALRHADHCVARVYVEPDRTRAERDERRARLLHGRGINNPPQG